MKKLLPLVALFVSTAATANGGLNIDTIDKHIDTTQWVKTSSVKTEVTPQASVVKFNAYMNDEKQVVDTDVLRHNYNGQS